MKHRSKTLIYAALIAPSILLLMSDKAFASTATLSISNFQAPTGAAAVIPITVNVTGGDINAFQITINYDENVIDVPADGNITLNPNFTGTVVADAGAGTSTITATATTPQTGVMELADISFSAVGASGTTSAVTVTPTIGTFLDSSGTLFDPEPTPVSATATVVDITPDAFSFPNQSNVPLSTFIQSAPITITGIDVPTSISTATGEYSIDGGPFTSAPGTVISGNVVVYQIMSSASYSTQTSGFLRIGTGGDDFRVTTLADPAIDTLPDAFSFVNQINVPLNTPIDSAPIIVTGINSPAPITITGGEYEINGSGTFTADPGTVNLNDSVVVRVVSSGSFSTPTSAILRIGGVGAITDDFRVTTLADPGIDIVPDAFTLVDQIDVTLSTPIDSAPITVLGINSPAAISIAGGEYEINGSGVFTSTPGTVNVNDSVVVRLTSSANFSTPTDATLTIGGVSDVFSATTLADVADTTPDAFTFVDQVDVPLNTQIASNSILVSGIGSPATISIVGGEYEINGSGTFVTTDGTVNANDTVVVRQTSSPTFSTTTDATLTVGGVNDIFSITTLAADTTPDQFTFVDQTDVALSTQINSNSITVAGIEAPAGISIVGGEYEINGSGTFTTNPGTVNATDTVVVRVTSSADFSTPAVATLTIGGVSDDFSVTTLADPSDSIPDAFNFSAITDAPVSTVETSNTITVSGINVPSAISISGNGGEYSINGGAFTSADGTVVSGDTVVVRQTSSADFATLTTTTLTIGTVSSDFEVTTIAPANVAPALEAIGNKNALLGQDFTFTAQASDANGDTLTFSLGGNAPAGASIDSNTGIFTWTPTTLGTFTFDVIVSDSVLTDTQSTTIVVTQTPVVVVNAKNNNNNDDDDRCGETCRDYREYRRKYKNDAVHDIYLELRALKRDNLAEFRRLENIYMTYRKFTDKEFAAVSPQVQADFKLFKKYNGYKHYKNLKERR